MNRQLLKTVSPITCIIRCKGYKHPGGIKYPGGIVYYPKNQDYQEPEITPSKLFRVERIKTLKHSPWTLKKILGEFHIDKEERVTVVKNIPEVNARLWKVKHLVKITPIKFPYGEPTEEDIKHTTLRENGECLVTKKLEIDQKQIEALENFDKQPQKMDSDTIKKDSRHKWNNAFTGGF